VGRRHQLPLGQAGRLRVTRGEIFRGGADRLPLSRGPATGTRIR
jgi:hypothetical protein